MAFRTVAYDQVSIPETMTAVEISRPGGPEVLKTTKRAVPKPVIDELLIHVGAAGINGPDVLQRKGLYDPPPGASDIPGLEIAGRVVAVGASVSRFAVGDMVGALVTGGGYAEYAVANENVTFAIPEGLTVMEAAALPETFMTVWLNLFERGRFRRGDSVLIHGGASGIGTTATMLEPVPKGLSDWGTRDSKGLFRPSWSERCGPQPLAGSIVARDFDMKRI